MLLEGSCRCGAVRFACRSDTPYPFMRCYCTICRKTGGGGGYAINLMAWAETLQVEHREAMTKYNVMMENGPSAMNRYFCNKCGTALWGDHPKWPELMHPFASAIDTKLPSAPETVHIMLDDKAPWVSLPDGKGHRHFPQYPDESIEEWHRRHGLFGTI